MVYFIKAKSGPICISIPGVRAVSSRKMLTVLILCVWAKCISLRQLSERT